MAANISYGLGQGSQYAPDSNQALLLQYLQQQQASGQDPDSLQQALEMQKNHPVYSVGQGLADVGSKIATAYINKQNLVRQAQAANHSAQLANAGNAMAGNASLARDLNTGQTVQPVGSGALYQNAAPGEVGNSGQSFLDAKPNAALMTPQQRAQAATDMVQSSGNAMLARQLSPEFLKTAQAASPSFTGALKQGEHAFVQGQDVASVPGARPEPKTVTTAAGVFALNPDGSLGTKLGDVPHEPQPKNLQTVTLNDGVYILNNDGSKTKIGEAPARERNPKMQTYYDDTGAQTQLDSNDPEDQKIIKARGLVSESPSDNQRASKGYLDRMGAAEKTLDDITGGGFNPGNTKDAVKGSIPLVGNYLVSDQAQLYKQAQEDWVRAKLRKESGAVIGANEMADEVKTYFPQPGDTEAVKAQKLASRRQAERQLATTSGILGRGRLRELDDMNAAAGADHVNNLLDKYAPRK